MAVIGQSQELAHCTSIHVEMGGHHPSMRCPSSACSASNMGSIKLIPLFLPRFADHILGMDDLRRFCDLNGGNALPVYNCRRLGASQQIFPYAILDKLFVRGYSAFQRSHAQDPDLPAAGSNRSRYHTVKFKPVSSLLRQKRANSLLIILNAMKLRRSPSHC